MRSDKRPVDFSKALDMSVKYLSYRPRTIKEMEAYLEKKKIETTTIHRVIEYLTDHNYLDDEAYCRQYIDYAARYKPKSLYALTYELGHKKGISRDIIETAITRFDDFGLAWSAVNKKLGQWQNFDDIKLKMKVFNFLRYRGFSYEVCKKTYECLKKGAQGEN